MDEDNATPGTAPRIVALAADMLFASRIRGTAQVVGVAVRIARNAQDVRDAAEAGARLALIDLDGRAGDVSELIAELRREHGDALRIIAFVSHVRTDAIATARHAGADQVLARSAFVRELPALLGSAR